MSEMKTCEQCAADYENGSGVSEDDRFTRYKLTERFCSDQCAGDYNEQYRDLATSEQTETETER